MSETFFQYNCSLCPKCQDQKKEKFFLTDQKEALSAAMEMKGEGVKNQQGIGLQVKRANINIKYIYTYLKFI